MNKMQELNQKLYDFVQRWADGATLLVDGVSLPDCIEYDVLSVIGRQLVEGQEQPAAQPVEVPA